MSHSSRARIPWFVFMVSGATAAGVFCFGSRTDAVAFRSMWQGLLCIDENRNEEVVWGADCRLDGRGTVQAEFDVDEAVHWCGVNTPRLLLPVYPYKIQELSLVKRVARSDLVLASGQEAWSDLRRYWWACVPPEFPLDRDSATRFSSRRVIYGGGSVLLTLYYLAALVMVVSGWWAIRSPGRTN